MEYADQVTIITTLRIDSPERKRNLDVVLRYLHATGIRVLLLEADVESRYQVDAIYNKVEYFFVFDEDRVFHRTRYLNQLLAKCVTPVVAVWDADIILSYASFEEGVRMVVDGSYKMVIPYNEPMVCLTEEETRDYTISDGGYKHLLQAANTFMPLMGRPSCGGLFIVHRETYLSCGGENEHFYGWGPEDAERVRRMEILGYPVYYLTRTPLFHLCHPRHSNSFYASSEWAFRNRQEFIKVCCMDAVELKKYVESWREINR